MAWLYGFFYVVLWGFYGLWGFCRGFLRLTGRCGPLQVRGVVEGASERIPVIPLRYRIKGAAFHGTASYRDNVVNLDVKEVAESSSGAGLRTDARTPFTGA